MKHYAPTNVSRLLALALMVGLLALSISCSKGTTDVAPAEIAPVKQEAKAMPMVASHYGRGDGFNGRKTASGEPFRADALTAAHKTLPFGTKLEVTNPENGKSVTVKVNDRGPFVKGRQLDLSAKAAETLGVDGVSKVVVKPVGE